MRIEVHEDTDTLHFRLDESRIADSEEIRPGLILDDDAEDRVVGVEFLGVPKRAAAAELTSIQFRTG